MNKIKHTSQKHKVMLSYIMFSVAILAPLSNYPQINKLFTLQITEGLSVETWIMYLLFAVIQLMYAVSNSIKPLIVSNVLWIIIELIMIYGILLFSVDKSPPEYSQLLLINNIGKAIGGIGIICLSSAAAMFAFDLSETEKKLYGKA